MEAKDVRYKILINNSETQLIKIFLYNYFEFFLSKFLVLLWIQIQIGPKSWIRIQIQCIWIHNTAPKCVILLLI